tara:strand:- start:6930 stop:7358 length:429 start_codon:yes stop_codon:yes gene_type:complete
MCQNLKKTINNMEITIKKTISKEILGNIFVTALEGGSNYWYSLGYDAIRKIRKAVPKETNPYLSVAILDAILEHNVEVDIHDAEDEEEVLGTITKATMQERLQKLANSEDAWALNNELECNGDATSSDVVFQYIVLGEVTFG